MSKQSVLLLNVGTPAALEAKAIRHYLREFLNDPYVVDLPLVLRFLLVNGLIIPARYQKTLHAYKKIWTENGSPLLINSIALKQRLSAYLGDDYQVEIAMRYGEPSIQSVLKKFDTQDKLIILPLFPQYARAVTESASAKTLSILKTNPFKEVKVVQYFYHDKNFIIPYANLIKTQVKVEDIDYILFSYHGLPEQHLKKISNCHHCDKLQACPKITHDNLNCYRAQCIATSHAIAKVLALPQNKYTSTFQSRLGWTQWIKPYTDVILPKLIQQGIKKIAIVCPSFVADCLETLEEINIRARTQWFALGGTEFIFVKSLNDDPAWIQGLARIIQSQQ